MTSTTARIVLTERDVEILTALDRCPLTIEQLQKISTTFAEPFASDSRVRGRLLSLRQAGWVRRWQYATVSRGGAPDYYKLTLTGHRLLYGPESEPATRRAFAEVGLSHQHHTRCLADFIVHTVVCAHRRGLPIVDFCRENTLRLMVGDETLFPDCAFRIRLPDQQFNFVVELDNGTERVRSQKDTESWERKIRLYEAYQDRSTSRFRVLIVSTKSRDRVDYIRESAATLVRNPQRTLFCSVHLDDYLAEADAVCSACFRDHRGQPAVMVGPQQLPLYAAPLSPVAPSRLAW